MDIKKRIPQILAAAASVLCVILVLVTYRFPANSTYAYSPYPYSVLQPESEEVEDIDRYAGKRYTYTFTVPDGAVSMRGLKLSFYLRNTIAEVTLDGETWFSTAETDSPHAGKTPGNYYVSLNFRSDYQGKTVKVSLTPVYKSLRYKTPLFLLIGRDELIRFLVWPQDRVLFILGALALTAGIFLAVTGLGLRIPGRDKKRIFHLGALTAMAGLWKLAGLPLIALMLDFYGINRVIWYTGAAGYLMMHLIILMFLNCPGGDESGGRAGTGQIITAIASAAVIVTVALQLLNVLELHEALWPFGLVFVFLDLYSVLPGSKKHRSHLWKMGFPIAISADLAVYFVTGSIRNGIFTLLFSIIVMCFRGVKFITDSVRRQELLLEKEKELRNANIQALTRQISPHFLYNTLSSIYYLCRDDPEQAMITVGNFSSYLQANFTGIAAAEPIPFAQELEHTRAYLSVEKTRYAEGLDVVWDTPFTEFRIPALTLQPVVENAVRHGSRKTGEPCRILISTAGTDNAALITVQDNGPGFDSADDGGNHVGLRNVRMRLSAMCGGTLDIRTGPEGTTVQMKIPVSTNY